MNDDALPSGWKDAEGDTTVATPPESSATSAQPSALPHGWTDAPEEVLPKGWSDAPSVNPSDGPQLTAATGDKTEPNWLERGWHKLTGDVSEFGTAVKARYGEAEKAFASRQTKDNGAPMASGLIAATGAMLRPSPLEIKHEQQDKEAKLGPAFVQAANEQEQRKREIGDASGMEQLFGSDKAPYALPLWQPGQMIGKSTGIGIEKPITKEDDNVEFPIGTYGSVKLSSVKAVYQPFAKVWNMLTAPGSLMTMGLGSEVSAAKAGTEAIAATAATKPAELATTGVFTKGMTEGAIQQVAALPDILNDPEKTAAQKFAAGTDAAVSVGMSYLALNHFSESVKKVASDPALTNEEKIDSLAKVQDIPHDAVMQELGEAVKAKAKQVAPTLDLTAPEGAPSGTPEGHIPVTVKRADGTTYDAMMLGYSDGVPNIGKRAGGGWSHTPLAPGEEIVGGAPPKDLWQQDKAGRLELKSAPNNYEEIPASELASMKRDEIPQAVQRTEVNPLVLETGKEPVGGNQEATKPLPANAEIKIPKEGEIGTPTITIPGKEGGATRSPFLNEPAPEFHGSPEEAKAAGYDITQQVRPDGEDTMPTDFSLDGMKKLAEEPKTDAATEPLPEGWKDAPEETPVAESGGETYGIAARVSADRAKAGKIEPIQPGEGTTPQEIIQKGRDLIDQGADPQAVANRVKETGASSENDVAIARAHGEDLAQKAKAAAEKFGVDSPEYAAAKKADYEWQQNVIQPLRTAWHRKGMAMQGETDIDTESFHGLAKAVHDVTGEDLTPKQMAEAKDLSEKAAKLSAEVETLKKQVLAGVKKVASEAAPRKKGLGLGDFFKEPAAAARERMRKRLSGEITSASITFGLESVPDMAIIAAEHLAKGLDAGAELVKEFGKSVEPHLDAILKAANEKIQAAYDERSAATLEAKRAKLADRVAELKKKLSEGDLSTEPKKANRPAVEPIEKLTQERDALNKQLDKLRNEAAKPTEVELVQRKVDAIKKQIEEKKAALASGDIEPKARELNRPQPKEIEEARQELEAVNKQIAEARKVIPANEEKNVTQDVWGRAKELLDKGEDGYPEIVNKIAMDTGLSEEQVHKILAGPKEVRTMTDEMYRKMADRRNLVRQAQDWVKDQQTPGYIKAVKVLPNAMFRLATALHGTVFGITHAAINIFNPLEWGTYWPNFLRQFKLTGAHDGGAYHERMMQQLEADPLFDFAARAGLNNSPHRITDDFQSAWTTHYLRQIGLMGNRGMDAIKIMRQAMFNNAWEKYSPELRTIDDAKLLADAVNHATGSIRTSLPGWTQYTFFSARLEGSRWAWMIQDPAKAAEIFTRWSTGKPTTYGERMFAMREFKQKAAIVGTYLGLLAANQGMLSASDSKQKVNFTDPMKSDFLAFKAGGKELSPVSPMLGLVRLFANLAHITVGTRDKFEKRDTKFGEAVQKVGEYARGRLSPFAGVTMDVTTGADAVNRNMPWVKPELSASGNVSLSALRQEQRQYSYTEYAATHFLPLFAEEAVREVWKKQGMDESTIHHWLDGLATAAVMGTTGLKVKDDTSAKK